MSMFFQSGLKKHLGRKWASVFSVRSMAPFNPRGVSHVLEANIKANVWLIGSQLEKTMAKEIKKKQPEIQEITQRTLDAHANASGQLAA